MRSDTTPFAAPHLTFHKNLGSPLTLPSRPHRGKDPGEVTAVLSNGHRTPGVTDPAADVGGLRPFTRHPRTPQSHGGEPGEGLRGSVRAAGATGWGLISGEMEDYCTPRASVAIFRGA
ncbi:hypothetical protein MC885_009726 [Smutsia gigantea]|nr:hypothetical protein MC885_009726 [Smutsia gigantea]